ncbi:unnamed protein product [Microthlaspi erraticum]|uniref:Uncharacterized protein n=1 Tax=Microthlaspi erraticum TaxID=1685480 RepID=A0A6D2HNW4_9BRAS|nr:unnamed protein product [Microthlaspi erraticum]
MTLRPRHLSAVSTTLLRLMVQRSFGWEPIHPPVTGKLENREDAGHLLGSDDHVRIYHLMSLRMCPAMLRRCHPNEHFELELSRSRELQDSSTTSGNT